MKAANVVDMNKNTRIPFTAGDRKKNKNDFYRFLLSQNTGRIEKIHNDVLIPRSILKKSEGTKRRRSIGETVEDPEQETLIGKRLKKSNPLLSPKFNQMGLGFPKTEFQQINDERKV